MPNRLAPVDGQGRMVSHLLASQYGLSPHEPVYGQPAAAAEHNISALVWGDFGKSEGELSDLAHDVPFVVDLMGKRESGLVLPQLKGSHYDAVVLDGRAEGFLGLWRALTQSSLGLFEVVGLDADPDVVRQANHTASRGCFVSAYGHNGYRGPIQDLVEKLAVHYR